MFHNFSMFIWRKVIGCGVITLTGDGVHDANDFAGGKLGGDYGVGFEKAGIKNI